MAKVVGVEQAIQAADRYLRTLVPDAVDIRLEEVELLERRRVWSVTLSFYWCHTVSARHYKQFEVRVSDGVVTKMRIRRLD